jgi:hypothetical protein
MIFMVGLDSGRCSSQLRHDILAEAMQLFDLISDRPDEQPLHTGVLEFRKLRHHGFGRAKGQTISKLINGSVQHRRQAGLEDVARSVVIEVKPHRR